MYYPRLRILIDPIYIQVGNLAGSSTYNQMATLVKELASRGHYVYWMIPDVDYTPSPIEDLPNVGIIRTEKVVDLFTLDGCVSDKYFSLFNRVTGKYPIDVVMTCRTGIATQLKRLLEPNRFHDTGAEMSDKLYGMPLVINEAFVQTPERSFVGEAYWLCQCMGYLSSDKTVFQSEHNMDEACKSMTNYIVASKVMDFAKNRAEIVPFGVNCEQLDQYFDEKYAFLDKNKFKVMSIGRLMGVSHVEYLDWFDYLYKSGMDDCELTLSLSGQLSGPIRTRLGKMGYDYKNNLGRQVKLYEYNNRDNFLRMLRTYDCFFAVTSHQDQPGGVWEALYLGVPGLIPESDYQRSFFKDYPFVIKANDKKDFLSKLLWIREHRQEAREMVKPWRDLIREKYNTNINNKKIADIIEDAAYNTINRYYTPKGVLTFMEQLKGETYSWNDVINFLKRQGKIGVRIGDATVRQPFTYSYGSIKLGMARCGYVDTCESSTPFFVRKDIFEGDNYDKTTNKSEKTNKGESLESIKKEGSG